MPNTRKKRVPNIDKRVCKMYAERKESISNLHKILSRIDVEKDAIKATPRISEGLPFFRNIANRLFGNMGKYDSSYGDMESRIECITETHLPLDSPRIYNIDNIDNNYYNNLLPANITHCIQDSGLSPIYFNNKITFIINPGSFLDPCKRTWDEFSELYGFDKILTKDNIFNNLQIPVTEMQCKTNVPNIFTFILDFGFKIIQVDFNNALQPINDDADTFFNIKGNKNKNDWFNLNKIDDEESAVLLILCKELGDTLQALYGKYYIMEQTYADRNKLCLFTCDKLLARRCQLLGVPVILNGPDKNLTENNYAIYNCQAMNTVSINMHEYYKNHVEQNNLNIIKTIDIVLNQKWYRLRTGQTVKTTGKIETILRAIKTMIYNRTQAFQTINSQHMTLLEYRLFTNHYRAISIFDCIQLTLNEGVDYLFIHKFSSDTPILKELRLSIPIIGGSDNNANVYKYDMKKYRFDFTTIDYSKYEEYDEEEYSIFTDYPIRIIIINKLYTLLTQQYPDKSKDECCYIANDIYNILYMYFCYLCESLYTDAFLKDCILAYTAPLLSYSEFADFYRSHTDNKKLDISDVSEYINKAEEIYNTIINTDQYTSIPTILPQLVSVIGGKKRRTYKKRRV